MFDERPEETSADESNDSSETVNKPNDPDVAADESNDEPAQQNHESSDSYPAQDSIDDLLADIERQIAHADSVVKSETARMESLRRERDLLYRRMAPGAVITQAQAHAAIVASGQVQRASRADNVQVFRELTGGSIPSVETPIERSLKSRPRTV